MSGASSTPSTVVNSEAPSRTSLPGDAGKEQEHKTTNEFKPDLRFWIVFLSMCLTCFLAALEVTAVATALPDMVADLSGTGYAWIGTAYSLAATALIPFISGLSALFGRRVVTLLAIGLFAIGCALAGAAPNMSAAIAGRAIQGAGGGAILVLSELIVVDLVPLSKRGAYFGVLGGVWALASAIGPIIGGALATVGQWRWIFFLNLPLSAIAAAMVFLFLRVKRPEGTIKEKLAKLDPMNLVFIPAATATTLGLQWSTSYGWASYKCLVPLILGLIGLAVWLYCERYPVKPVIPPSIVTQRTSIVGYIQTLLQGILIMLVIYYLPTGYFQGAKGDNAVMAGVHILSVCLVIAPAASLTGAVITATSKYKVANFVGFALMTLGLGLMSLLEADSSTGYWVGFPLIAACGLGASFITPQYTVQAPITPVDQPAAQTFFVFVRSLGQIFGVAIGSSVLGTELNELFPPEFAAMVPGESADDAFALIPVVSTLPEMLRTQVQSAFAQALKVNWYVATGVAGAGFLLCFGIEEIALSTEVDATYGIEEKKSKKPADETAA